VAEFVLCVDVGNSRTKFGLFRHEPAPRPAAALPECLAAAALPHGKLVQWDNLRRELDLHREDEVRGFITGSNPEAVGVIRDGWPSGWRAPTLLDDVTEFPLEIRLEKPNHAGVDRILNAVAGNTVRPAGTPAVIVDTGTATTVDAVSPEGAFEGGSILPGFELCARALHQYTALLPFVTIDELSNESHEALGTSTREALRSGLLWGQIGAIRELLTRLSARWSAAPFVLLTGGGAPLAAPELPEARWEPCLSLQGLAVVVEHLAGRLKDFGELSRGAEG
jgi:type III pantothenate kinase